jgi:hypothetical protein
MTVPSTLQVLQVEYKYQKVGQPIANSTTMETGFIYPNAMAPLQSANAGSGLSAFLIPLPPPTLEGQCNLSVRVYSLGDNASYTAWSDPLQVVPSPPTPVILAALYDNGDYDGNLYSRVWVQLNPSSLSSGDKYIASYYYVKRGESQTTWGTTGLLDIVTGPSPENNKYVVFPANGVVSSDVNRNNLYIAVNAILPFNDDNNYSISQISDTIAATKADANDAPDLLTAVYNQTSEGVQTVALTWNAPKESFIPDLGVENYYLQVRIDQGATQGSWTLAATLPNAPLSYTYPINSSSYPEGYTFNFKMSAMLETGSITDDSNVLSVTQTNYVAPVLNSINYLEYNDIPQLREQIMRLTWEPAKAGTLVLTANYHVYLSINNASYNQIAQVGNLLTYDYELTSDDLESITVLSFKVDAELSTGVEIGPSNPQSKKSFTYPSAPLNALVNWSQSSSTAGVSEFSFTFAKMSDSSLGLGAQQTNGFMGYLWQIVSSDGSLVTSATISGPNDILPNMINVKNSVNLNGLNAQVQICAQVKDTNSLAIKNGLNIIAGSVVVSELPSIYAVAVEIIPQPSPYDQKTRVTFKVSSNTVLSPVAALIYSTGITGQPPFGVTIDTNLAEQTYDDDDNVFEYDFTSDCEIDIDVAYSGFIIVVSNAKGERVSTYTPV